MVSNIDVTDNVLGVWGYLNVLQQCTCVGYFIALIWSGWNSLSIWSHHKCYQMIPFCYQLIPFLHFLTSNNSTDKNIGSVGWHNKSAIIFHIKLQAFREEWIQFICGRGNQLLGRRMVKQHAVGGGTFSYDDAFECMGVPFILLLASFGVFLDISNTK